MARKRMNIWVKKNNFIFTWGECSMVPKLIGIKQLVFSSNLFLNFSNLIFIFKKMLIVNRKKNFFKSFPFGQWQAWSFYCYKLSLKK